MNDTDDMAQLVMRLRARGRASGDALFDEAAAVVQRFRNDMMERQLKEKGLLRNKEDADEHALAVANRCTADELGRRPPKQRFSYRRSNRSPYPRRDEC